MKIAILHYRLIRRGGLETRLLNYLEEFSKKGHQVTVICAKWDQSISLPANVEVIKLNLGIMLKPFRAWYFSYKAQKLMPDLRFDFVLSLGRTKSQDAVLMPGGHLGYMEALEKKWKSLSDFMQILLDQNAFDSSQIIFAASNMMKRELVEKFKIQQEKIRLLFPPLNSKKFNQELRPQREKLREDFELLPDQKVFVFVSTSHFRKGLDILLKIFAQLDTQKYVLLIAGLPKVKSKLSNVRYLSFLDDPRALYTAADFMILPARYEPFGQVVSEALACGTPVMISSMVGAQDIVGPKEGIVVSSLEVSEWINTIKKHSDSFFSIPLDFAKEKELSLDQHVNKMLESWEKKTNNSSNLPVV